MSWQTYVDQNLVGAKKVTTGAIAGFDGSIWARSPTLNITAQEAKNIYAGYSNPSTFQASGIVVAGVKYMFLRVEGDSLIGKKGQGGVHIAKTNKALIIGVYDAPILPTDASTGVEKIADYLKGTGY